MDLKRLKELMADSGVDVASEADVCGALEQAAGVCQAMEYYTLETEPTANVTILMLRQTRDELNLAAMNAEESER